MPVRIATMVFLALCCSASAQRIIFVRSAATGASDGTTWNDAYRDLQDALDDVRDNGGCPCEIWVAAGIYKPHRGTGDPTLAFELLSNVGLFGGFAGWEALREQRDIVTNNTILDGDLLGNDDDAFEPDSCCVGSLCNNQSCYDAVVSFRPSCAGNWTANCAYWATVFCCELCSPTRCDNSYNIIRGTNLDQSAVLDGLVVTRGNARLSGSSPYNSGGAVHVSGGYISIRNCVFRDNAGLRAPVIAADALELSDTLIEGRPGLQAGHAVQLQGSYDFVSSIRRCAFLGCTEGALDLRGDAVVSDSSFVANGGDLYEGAGIQANFNYIAIDRCMFLNNTQSAIDLTWSIGHIRQSVFVGNSAESHGGAISADASSIVISDCLFYANRAGRPGIDPGHGGAISAALGPTLITNCTVVANTAGVVGGLHISDTSVENSIIWGNFDDLTGYAEHAQIGSV